MIIPMKKRGKRWCPQPAAQRILECYFKSCAIQLPSRRSWSCYHHPPPPGSVRCYQQNLWKNWSSRFKFNPRSKKFTLELVWSPTSIYSLDLRFFWDTTTRFDPGNQLSTSAFTTPSPSASDLPWRSELETATSDQCRPVRRQVAASVVHIVHRPGFTYEETWSGWGFENHNVHEQYGKMVKSRKSVKSFFFFFLRRLIQSWKHHKHPQIIESAQTTWWTLQCADIALCEI